jgi:hypothetical protein
MTKMVTLQTYIKIIHGKKTINNDDLASIIKGIEVKEMI